MRCGCDPIMSNKAQILFYFGGRENPLFTAAAQFGWFCNNDSFVLLEYKYWRLVLPFNEFVIHFYLSDMNLESTTNSCTYVNIYSYHNFFSKVWPTCPDFPDTACFNLVCCRVSTNEMKIFKSVTYIKQLEGDRAGSYLSLFLF